MRVCTLIGPILALTLGSVACTDGGDGGTTPPTGTSEAERLQEAIYAVLAEDGVVLQSCADVYVALFDKASNNALLLTVAGQLSSEAFESQQRVQRNFALPDEDVVLRVQWGRRLGDSLECDDVIEEKPEIAGQADAIGGRVNLLLEPGDDYGNTQLDLSLEDVTFEVIDGTGQGTLESLELTDLTVGWFPG